MYLPDAIAFPTQATEQCFNLDYRYPLTMVQAFAIAISR